MAATRAHAIRTELEVLAALDRPGCRHPDGRPHLTAIGRAIGRTASVVLFALRRVEARGGPAVPFDPALPPERRALAGEHAGLAARFAADLARRWALRGEEAEDARDGAIDGLLDAARRWQGRGRFSTYAWACMDLGARNALRTGRRRRALGPAAMDPRELDARAAG